MGLGVLRSKIWHDLWKHKARTLQVVAIIAAGSFITGMTLGNRVLALKDMTRNWMVSRPATIGLLVDPAVDEATIESLENLKGIETVVGWQQEPIKWRNHPGESWQPGLLVAVEDYQDQPLRQIRLDKGSWPHYKLIGLQRGYDSLVTGDQVYLEIDDTAYQMQLSGQIYNPEHPSLGAGGVPMFFTTRQRFKELTGEANNRLVLAAIPNYTAERVEAAADRLQAELEKQDVEVSPALFAPGNLRKRTAPADRMPLHDATNALFFMMSMMGVATLILGLFLVYNTVEAILSQQVSQIGVMKAVGATTGRILAVYFSTVFVYAGLALVIAVPLGALGAHGMRVSLMGRMGVTPGPFEFVPQVVAIQVILTLFSPLLIALVPLLSGVRVTVREAISTYGLGGSSTLLERLLAKVQFMPRLVALTIGNTFRHKRRVMLTQITLAGAGVLFMVVLTVNSSLNNTFGDVVLSIFQSNVMLELTDEARIQKIERLALTQPEVKAVEVWSTASGTARLKGQPESPDDKAINLRGVPLPSITYQPQLRAGRWLQPDDTQAMALNQTLAAEMGVGVGDWLTVDIPTQGKADWQIVGLIFEPTDQQSALVPRNLLLKEIGQVGRGKAIRIQTVHTDPESEIKTAEAIRALYQAHGYETLASNEDTSHRLAAKFRAPVEIITSLLSLLAGVLTLVGAIALNGTLVINIMERTREIGVMRAIGASTTAIMSQFIGEGMLLGWLSWLIAIPLSIPLGIAVVNAFSFMFNTEMVYRYAGMSLVYWFGLVTIVATLASWLPAWKAARTTVRENLAYV